MNPLLQKLGLLAGSLVLLLLVGCSEPSPVDDGISGPLPKAQEAATVSSFSEWDAFVVGLMEKYDIPGASLAVALEGEIVYTQPFGYADLENKIPVTEVSLFRIASLSKPITAAAIGVLIEEGKLKLEDKVFEKMPHLLPEGTLADPRVLDITVEHLLEHKGGWDRDQYHDPMLRRSTLEAARFYEVSPPGIAEAVIRYRLRQPLDYVPGTRFAYSNLGYLVLGRVMENVTGRPYVEAVQELLLKPLGEDTIFLGSAQRKNARMLEVVYYDYGGAEFVPSVFDRQELVPYPYGGFDLQTIDAAAGWIASAPALLRLFLQIAPSTAEDSWLHAKEHPAGTPTLDTTEVHHPGWTFTLGKDGGAYWVRGSMPGTTAFAAMSPHQYSWLLLLNGRPSNYKEINEDLVRWMQDQF